MEKEFVFDTAKKRRKCHHCGEPILKGEHCITFIYGKGSRFQIKANLCKACVKLWAGEWWAGATQIEKPKAGEQFIFVYGTLKKGGWNWPHLLNREPENSGYTVEQYQLNVDRGGLCWLTKEPHTHIQGEVYSVNQQELRRIDSLEGHPNYYKRERIAVRTKAGLMYDAWCYFLLEPSRFPNSGVTVSNTGVFDATRR